MTSNINKYQGRESAEMKIKRPPVMQNPAGTNSYSLKKTGLTPPWSINNCFLQFNRLPGLQFVTIVFDAISIGN